MSMIRRVLFVLIIILLLAGRILTDDEACGDNIKCVKGTCINANYNVCECRPEYTTVPEDNPDNCSYAKKYQVVAFILEVFCMFGAGHFYILNYSVAVTKLLIFVLGYLISVSIRFLGNKENANTSSGVMVAFFGCFFCCIMITWQILDIILFSLNKYKDGYNIELLPWGS